MSRRTREARPLVRSAAVAVALLCAHAPASTRGATFSYDPPGTLVPARSGQGRIDSTVYAPTMLFPIADGAAFANSQVYGHGGGQGPAGTSQCDAENFSYPWHDNYCETRSWSMPLCPAGTGHQGQDIRAADCKKNVHAVVAAEDGTITNVGSYSVYLTTDWGTRFDYLHMGSVAVTVGQEVRRGQVLGKVSNEFAGTPTTVHLHFNIRQAVAGVGTVYVPPYTSLVEAYQRQLAAGADGGADAGALDAGPPDAGTEDAGAGPRKGLGEACREANECALGRCHEVCVAQCDPTDEDLRCEPNAVCAEVQGGMGCVPLAGPEIVTGCALSRGTPSAPSSGAGQLGLVLLCLVLVVATRSARCRCNNR